VECLQIVRLIESLMLQNGVSCSIKPQQITYIVPNVYNFDHTGLTDFLQRAQDNLVRNDILKGLQVFFFCEL